MGKHFGVIGAGIIGLAIAEALSARGDEVTVLEKESRVAAHQSGHNSSVVHAGLYYPPRSFKAQLCAAGRQKMAEFCQHYQLPYERLGKLVVATREEELAGLAEIYRRAETNAVPGLRRLSAAEVSAIEPAVHAVAGIHSPHTAVTDFAVVCEQLAQNIRQAGGRVLLNTEVLAAAKTGGRVSVETTSGEYYFDRLIMCGGLYSDVLAQMVGAEPSPRILPFRGEYWTMPAERSWLVRGMVYPVPDPKLPFLGVHFTRSVYGQVHIGPNAVPALAREGYRWRDCDVAEVWQQLRWPGAPALARKYWKVGVQEMWASLHKRSYFRQAQQFIPALKYEDLHSRPEAGVRAQAWDLRGQLVDDFVVHSDDCITMIRNAPSPAATSSLAIADYVLQEHLG